MQPNPETTPRRTQCPPTRLVVLMPVGEAVNLARAILEKAGRSTP